ncbi:hypothetical protein PV10_02544 [Exophiala mesophila]|uniref:Uncharacterized protein n=1 Tax=Exophiala mesophila TaxID=212818 RepID=A0A0D1ZJK4_EXOME|nr:uncharacterized protein PV10_02544 [Exophiala mesophila]KIV94812.1 hypothetical protein PV10_02544 [Exophiala mesophila]
MSTSSRDASRDRAESRLVKHQHSFSESGRASVPMWDSSDPERAPPPLPLHPGNPGSPITRSNTSKRIDEAAALITARARENAPSSYTTNPLPLSPDRNIMRAQNRRMQNIQSPSVSRLSDSLERRSPDKGLRTAKFVDFEDFRSSRSSDRPSGHQRSETPTPGERASARSREHENTPPGTGILTLHGARGRQDATPLSDITNGTPLPTQPSYSFDSLSTQILSLTNLVTNVQKEMMSLNKRSKENHGDITSLKLAATTRDEDLYKNLRELVNGLESKFTNLDARLLSGHEDSRQGSNLGMYLDEKAHNGSPRKSFGLPRIGSPSGFSMSIDRELTASPSLACVDGAASIALLEKVLREMATREGQEAIRNTLESVKSQALVRGETAPSSSQPTVDPTMMAKLEDILVIMKDLRHESNSRALIRSAGPEHARPSSNGEGYDNGVVSRSKGTNEDRNAASASNFVNDEMMKLMKSIKQSLAQSGGLTNEVKILVRDLRGEVLGMGREIARKMEQTSVAKKGSEKSLPATQEEIAAIVHSGFAELKESMHQIVESSRQRAAHQNRSTVEAEAVLLAVRTAIADIPPPRETPERDVAAERAEMILAVREAWEDCKPEIALEHFGLERDEILETLKEGLKSYQPQHDMTKEAGATYDEVVAAVSQALSTFKLPQMPQNAGVTRDEVVAAVRECFDDFEWPNFPGTSSRNLDLTRDDVLDAVREGLSNQDQASNESVADAIRDGFAQQQMFSKEFVADALKDGLAQQGALTKEIEFNRDDLFDAIKACLEGEQNPLGGMGERVIEAMHEFLGSMKTEFQQYSAASGKDTEQVLDALKDGLEDLRGDIESYVDRASDVTGKDEIIDTVKAGFAVMQVDLEKGFASRSNMATNTPELLDAMEKEFQHLRDTISKSMGQGSDVSSRDEILDAIRDLSDDRQSALSSNSEDIVRLVKEELEHMRVTLAATLLKSGGSSLDRDEVLETIREGIESSRSAPKSGNESILSNTSELLDAFQDGVDGIRVDLQKLIERPSDLGSTYEILDSLKVGIEEVKADIQRLHEKQTDNPDSESPRGQEMIVHDQNRITTEIEALKVMITQLRIKVESLDHMEPPPAPTEMRMHKDDMDELYGAIRHVEDVVSRSKSTSNPEIKEDLDGIFTAIRQVDENVSKIRETSAPDVTMPENAASKDDTDAIETLLRNVKAQLDEVFFSPGPESIAKTGDIVGLEDLLRDIKVSVDESADRVAESSGKEDFTMIELLLKDVQAQVEDVKAKVDTLDGTDNSSNKEEVEVVQTLCMDIKAQIAAMKLPDVETIPSKDDIVDVRNDLKAFREQLEADNGLTAQAFEARKIEHGGLATKIDDVKGILSDLRDELMLKIDGSADGIVELNKVLGTQHDDISKYATAIGLAELSDMIKAEFDKNMAEQMSMKGEMEERDATLFSKHDETGAVLKAIIDEKFSELISKYDDGQIFNEAKLNALEDHDTIQMEATSSTRTAVEDLKLVMESLGLTMTETCDRVSADSKTVFEAVEECKAKLDDLYTANASDHGATRDEVAKTLMTVTRLESTMDENQPALLAAIREILGVVNQHYEHSQQQAESFAKATEEIKSGVDSIPAAIPPLLPALPAAPSSPIIAPEPIRQEKYDDSEVHDKLDTLLSHAALAKEMFAGIENHQQDTRVAFTSMSKLDEIHQQVMTTAAEIAGMVTTQARLMGEHHESKAAEATEAAIALEKRTAQKEKVEAEIVALGSEKNALIESMAELRREQEELRSQTKKLTRDVGKLETALQIRQEEMRDMNARAEMLERRILEGLVNQARTARAPRGHPREPVKSKITPAERDASMNLRRVSSNASTVTRRSSLKSGGTNLGSAVGMALKKRAPLIGQTPAITTPRTSAVDRRILSTSHVTGNRRQNAPDLSLVLAPVPKSTGLASLKRSQSVKSNPSSYANGRKASWNGAPSEFTDKENVEVLHENGEESDSDGDTERRTSYGTSIMYSDSMTYGTGTSISSRSRRSTSAASSIIGAVNGQDMIAEEDEEGEDEVPDEETAMVLHNGGVNAGQDNSADLNRLDDVEIAHAVVDGLSILEPPPLITEQGLKYSHDSDSGLGTEPLTAGTEERRGEAQEYFQMTAQDMRG